MDMTWMEEHGMKHNPRNTPCCLAGEAVFRQRAQAGGIEAQTGVGGVVKSELLPSHTVATTAAVGGGTKGPTCV